MNTIKKVIFPVLFACIWISISEFTRNELLFKDLWTAHYSGLGLNFPSAPVNGMIWGLWSLAFAVFIYVLNGKFSFWQTVAIAWFAGFVMMWIVVGNLSVLPFALLWYAVPLSLLEVFLAALIIQRLRQ